MFCWYDDIIVISMSLMQIFTLLFYQFFISVINVAYFKIGLNTRALKTFLTFGIASTRFLTYKKTVATKAFYVCNVIKTSVTRNQRSPLSMLFSVYLMLR